MQADFIATSQDTHGSAAHHGVIRWNAIIAGTFVTLAVWAMLYTLGAALGLSAISPNSSTSLRASGIFTGTWSVLSPLVALFCGAWFTSRGAAARTRSIGAMHGLVMWSLSTLGFAWLFVNLLTSVVDGAVGAGKQALSMGGRGVVASMQGSADAMHNAATSAVQALGDNMGLDMDDALKSVNTRLRAAGRTPIDPKMMGDALRGLVKTGMRQGKLDREDIVKVVLETTPLERQDADDISQKIQAQLANSKGSIEDALAQAKQAASDGAYKTADVTGKAFWGIFTVLFLGMIASVGGGFFGVRDAYHP